MTQLKAIASELGIKPTGDSRRRQTWVQAIRHAAVAVAGAVTEGSAPAAAAETTVVECGQLTIEEAVPAVSPTTRHAAAVVAGAVTEVENHQLTIEEVIAAVSPTISDRDWNEDFCFWHHPENKIYVCSLVRISKKTQTLKVWWNEDSH